MFKSTHDNARKKDGLLGGQTLLAQGSSIRGEIHLGEGSLRLEGQFEGTIYGQGEVFIEATGQVVGTVLARHLIVAGRAEGLFKVEERLEIRPTGSVEGDVEAGAIVVDEGGVFQGSCSRPGLKARAETSGPRSPDLLGGVADYSGSRGFGIKPN